MQYAVGGTLHLSGLQNSMEGIACTVSLTAWRQTGSDHYCYKEIKTNKQHTTVRIVVQLGLDFRPSFFSQIPAYPRVN